MLGYIILYFLGAYLYAFPIGLCLAAGEDSIKTDNELVTVVAHIVCFLVYPITILVSVIVLWYIGFVLINKKIIDKYYWRK